MKASECKWFGCVYAINSGCGILGYRDEPYKEGQQKTTCPQIKMECIRVECDYCRRQGEKGVCPLESED